MKSINWTRRDFIKSTGLAGGMMAAVPSFSLNSSNQEKSKKYYH